MKTDPNGAFCDVIRGSPGRKVVIDEKYTDQFSHEVHRRWIVKDVDLSRLDQNYHDCEAMK